MDTWTGPPGPRVPEVLWGREREIGVLDGLAEGLDKGIRGVLVVGEPGIGKSSLWARGVSAASRAGLRVMSTTCVEAEYRMPYCGLEELVSGLLDERGNTLPAPQRDALEGAFVRRYAESATNLRAVAAGVVALLRGALDAGLVMLAVDDLQWLDAETDTCLTYAVRRLGDTGLRLLLAARDESPLWPEPHRGTLVAVVERRITTLRPGPLSGRSVRWLMRDRLGLSLSSDDSRRLVTQTGGNPFWVLQIGGVEYGEPDQARPPVLGPASLGAVVAERVAHLDRAAVEAVCLVAVLGRPCCDTVLSVIGPDGAGDRRGEAELILDRAIAAGLVSMDGGRLTPTHPLIGTALLASLTPFRRRRLYRQAARLVESAEARALHLLRATRQTGDGADAGGGGAERAEVLTALDAAALAARRRGAASTAARFASHALALVESEAARHPDASSAGVAAEARARMVATAETDYQAGEYDAALALLNRVDLRALDPDLIERAAPLLAETTNMRLGAPAARAVVAALDGLPLDGPSAESAVRRQALVAALRADALCGAVGDRRAVARRAVEQTGSSPARVPLRRRALASLAHALIGAGEDAEEILDRLEALGAPDLTEPGGGVHVELLRGASRICALDLDGQRRVMTTVLDRALPAGDAAVSIGRTADLLALYQHLAGLPAEAEKTLARLEEHVDPRTPESPIAIVVRGTLHLARGEHDAVDALLGEWEATGDCALPGVGLTAHLRGVLARQRGDHADALGFFEVAADVAEQRVFFDPLRRLWALVDLAEALVAVGEHARAEAVVDRFDAPVDGPGRRLVRGLRRRTLAGLVAGRDRDLGRAEEGARDAVDLLARCPFPAERGRSLVTLARIQDMRGDAVSAVRHRRRAHAIFTNAGCTWWAEHTTAPARLSASESAVADLVARGATNRGTATALHLSVRTVENHLRSVYRKLGIRSRAELTVDALDEAAR